MAKKPAHVSVSAKECRGNHERMIRRFLKKSKKAKVVEQCRDRARYKKPSIKKREKRNRAERDRLRQELKKQRAQERRNRKNR